MPTDLSPNCAQAQLWNGHAGRAWVEIQAVLDALFQPFEEQLVAGAVAQGARRVLDIGCGTGSTTLAIARRLGTGSELCGIDLSEPMIATARERAVQEGSPARFRCVDAQRAALEPGHYDRLVSRFGVMFFDDPVQAFRNLRAAAAPGAPLHAIAWRAAAENLFMTTAEKAAATLLALPARASQGPGQFAFADAAQVRSLLQASGWADVALTPLDVECAMPEAALGSYLRWLGPVGQALQQADAATRERVLPAVRAAFAPFVQGDTVRFTAACWTLTARNR